MDGTRLPLRPVDGGRLQAQPGCGRRSYRLEHHSFVYVIGGQILLGVDGHSMRLCAGQVGLLPPEVVRSSLCVGDDPVEALWIDFDASLALPLSLGPAEEIVPRNGPGSRRLEIGISEEVVRVFSAIIRELRSDKEDAVQMTEILIMQLILTLRRLGAERSRRVEPDAPAALGVWRAREVEMSASVYMTDNLAAPITVEQIARHVHLSPQRFRAVFKEANGRPPMKHLVQMRIARARELLATSGASVGEVGRSVGFSSAPYFSRVFRQHVGQSPRMFRHGTLVAPDVV